MEDMAEKIQQILSSAEGQQQLQDVVKMLSGNDGNIDMSKVSNFINNQDRAGYNQGESNNNFDLTGLNGIPGNESGNLSNNNSFNLNNLDLSKLSGILGNLNLSGNNSTDKNSNNPDLSKIIGMLGGGNSGEKNVGGLNFGGLDMNMLMNIQKLLSAMNYDDKNIALIKAIKPHLKEERQSKADDAIKMMQLMSLLPMLRDSGLFGSGKTEDNESI